LLWRSLSPLLGRDRDVAGNTDHTADSFAQFLDKKVRDVTRAIGNRRAAAATDIENSVVIAGVVQTLYAD